jgi:competence protein ComEC
MRRPAVPACGCLLLGLAVSAALQIQPRPAAGLTAGLIAAALLALATRTPAAVLVHATLFSAGVWVDAADRSAHATLAAGVLPRTGAATEMHFVGRVIAPPVVEFDGRVVLRLEGRAEPPARSAGLTRLTLHVHPSMERPADAVARLRTGDRVRAWCRVGAPRDSPRRRIGGEHARASVKNQHLVERMESSRWVRPWDVLRDHSLRRIDACGASGDVTALLRAMLLGDRGGLHPPLCRSLRDSGLLHLISISGLHVSIVVWMLHAALVRLGLGPRGRLAGLLVLLSFFAAFVGPRSSVLRAAITTGVVLLGRCTGRHGDGVNSLAAVAAALAAIEPASLSDPGFQLTFLATAGILLLAPSLAESLPLPRVAATPLAVSLSAHLFTGPVLAWHFGWIAPVGLLTNLVAAPLCAAVLLAGYGAVLLPGEGALGSLGFAAGRMARLAGGALLTLSRAAAAWDAGAFPVPHPSAALVTGYFATLLAWLVLRGRGREGASLTLCGSLLAALVVWLHLGPPPQPGTGRREAALLDVGQGLAVALRGPDGRTVLVDAGGSADPRFDPGERTVVPFLRATSGRRVEAVVVTHDHVDHIGGAFAVIRDLEVGELWLGPGTPHSPRQAALAALARTRGTAIVLAERGRVLRAAGFPARILAPGRDGAPAERNDRSVVLLAGTAPSRLLIPGDLEVSGEAALLREPDDLEAEALVVTHHGSRHGTAEEFLQRVRPRWALISAGWANPFGHPHPETLERLRRAGIAMLRTDRLGCVSLQAAHGGWSAVTPCRWERR